MMQLTIKADPDLCLDCKACEVACKAENKLPVGLRWLKINKIGPVKKGDKLVTKYSPSLCRHCAKAPCIESCPVEAISKKSNGIVLIDEELCIGCGDCISACPFSVIGLNPETNAASKCTLCEPRLEREQVPACVKACQSGAIYYGDFNEVSLKLRKDRAQRRA